MPKRVTILDVAAAAGVSRQTVTRAVNGMDGISDATRDRVLAARDRLGYRPSRFARGLVERTKTHALGLVVASFRNPYYTDIAGDLLAAAVTRGWQLMMTSPEAGHGEEALELLARQVDVIVGHLDPEEARQLSQSAALPVVLLEDTIDAPGVHSVTVDLEGGIREAVAELRRRGARTFGMVDSGYTARDGHSYEPSPRRGWFEAAVGSDLSGVVVAEETIGGGATGLTELVRSHPSTDAVLMFNDLMALGAVQAAASVGRVVPEDLRIVGVDGLSLGEAVTPRLSTIAIDRQALADRTMEIVDRLAEADFGRLSPILLSTRPRLLWRESA